jgi:hypothetical protein
MKSTPSSEQSTHTFAAFEERPQTRQRSDRTAQSGEQHPRGFVQQTVLKTITEHPQGLTTAELIALLKPLNVGQQSIFKRSRCSHRGQQNHIRRQRRQAPARRRQGPHCAGAAEFITFLALRAGFLVVTVYVDPLPRAYAIIVYANKPEKRRNTRFIKRMLSHVHRDSIPSVSALRVCLFLRSLAYGRRSFEKVQNTQVSHQAILYCVPASC